MPKKTKAQISFNMSRIRSKGSLIEKIMGKLLWHAGLRYRKHYSVIGKPDFVLPKKKIAVFCDSSFWHGYKLGKTSRHQFRSNKEFWIQKIKKNIERDKKVNKELKELGWKVFRFWDFEINSYPETCLRKIINHAK